MESGVVSEGDKEETSASMVLKSVDQERAAEIRFFEKQINKRWILRVLWGHPHVTCGSLVDVFDWHNWETLFWNLILVLWTVHDMCNITWLRQLLPFLAIKKIINKLIIRF